MSIPKMKQLLLTGEYKLYSRMSCCDWHEALDFTLQEDYYKVIKNDKTRS
jgi:hypothetical protein